jgi:hypothetical protein
MGFVEIFISRDLSKYLSHGMFTRICKNALELFTISMDPEDGGETEFI